MELPLHRPLLVVMGCLQLLYHQLSFHHRRHRHSRQSLHANADQKVNALQVLQDPRVPQARLAYLEFLERMVCLDRTLHQARLLKEAQAAVTVQQVSPDHLDHQVQQVPKV